jgi:hypothetical protein
MTRAEQTLRFTNDDVLKNLEGVVLTIADAMRSSAPPSLSLPRKGGGDDGASSALLLRATRRERIDGD